jgi:hypothetical protein
MIQISVRATSCLVALCLLSSLSGQSRGEFGQGDVDPMDAVIAAPKNHKVLFEDDHVRLLEVTVQPGETENMHVHRNPSVLVYDAAQPRLRSHRANGTSAEWGRNCEGADRIIAAQNPIAAVGDAWLRRSADFPTALATGWPVAMALGGDKSGPHQVTNLDTFPHHFYRLEFKRIDGNGIMKLTSY